MEVERLETNHTIHVRQFLGYKTDPEFFAIPWIIHAQIQISSAGNIGASALSGPLD
jgi:hypothetical protein